jgi:hemolysin III
MTERAPTRAEERVHSATHAAGAVLGGALGLWLLSQAAGDATRAVSVAVYAASIVILFSASALYHGLSATRARAWLQFVDHAAIFLLIAGTTTPFALVTLQGAWGWSIFGVVWGAALAGITFEGFFLGRWPRVSTAMYLLTGWIGAVAVVPLWDRLPLGGWAWLLAGGLAYTGGVAFFARDRPWDHAIWHLFVLAGAGCHAVAVGGYVLA